MKRGVESQTAVLVCMARALAHERTADAEFSDPTALRSTTPTRSARSASEQRHSAHHVDLGRGRDVPRVTRNRIDLEASRCAPISRPKPCGRSSKFHFGVDRDDDLGSIALELSPELANAARRIRHNRVVVASRLPA